MLPNTLLFKLLKCYFIYPLVKYELDKNWIEDLDLKEKVGWLVSWTVDFLKKCLFLVQFFFFFL